MSMKRRFVFLLLLFQSCHAQDPPKAAAPPSAEEALGRALQEVGSKKVFEVTAKARYTTESGATLDYSAAGLWRSPGVFYVRPNVKGDQITHNAVWIEGDGTWVYHDLLKEWVPAKDIGLERIAIGIHNPSSLFQSARSHLKDALYRDGSLTLSLRGPDVRELLVVTGHLGRLDDSRSTMELTFIVGAEGALSSVSFKGTLIEDLRNSTRTSDYSGEVALVPKGDEPSFNFRNGEGRTIALNQDLKKRIASIVQDRK
jgi:hypothetical protein